MLSIRFPQSKSLQSLRTERFSKANLYLKPDVVDSIPPWAGQRPNLRMSRAEAESLIALLSGQPGLEEVALYEGQSIDIDLDQFRKVHGVDFGRGDICRYYSYAFKCQPCLYLPWLKVDPSDKYANAVLVNRTQRYHGRVSYNFLAGLPNVFFIGYPHEYADFIKDCPRIPHINPDNAKTLASYIAGCKAFVGNQSFCFSLAEALKVPRLLELYPPAPNVIIHGPKGWDAINQAIFQEIAEGLCG